MCICSSMYEIVSGGETERLDFFSQKNVLFHVSVCY